METAPAQEKDPTPELVSGSASIDISIDEVLKVLVGGYGTKASEEDKKKFAELLSKRLYQESTKITCSASYNIAIIFDNTSLIKSDSNRLYKALNGFSDKTKPLLLILLSRGGEPGSAYLIGKLCRESTIEKFVVVIPRYAKSAATLLATAANEIHMGSLSELGPIDPQIDNMPTLGLKNSIEHIAELVSKMPGSAEMFARYLGRTVEPIQIGYYERVAESAMQYAQRLLESHKATLESSPEDIARKLVYGYKDHGFVIDQSEARDIFGAQTIKSKSDEYSLGNNIYNELSKVEEIAGILGYNFFFIGSLDSKPELIKRK